jgi:hypothetical protein
MDHAEADAVKEDQEAAGRSHAETKM